MTGQFRSPLVRAAALVFLAGSLVLAWTLRVAMVQPSSAVEIFPLEAPAIAPFEARSAADREAALAAVEIDPFRQERRRPLERFRLPGEAAASVGQLSVDAGPRAPRLIGTVVLPNGRSVAMAQTDGEPPRVVRIGENIGDYVLRNVERGRATFVAPDGERLELVVPRPGS